MPQFRKKPVVIEAEQWTGSNLNDDNSLFQRPEVCISIDGSSFKVPTLEGMMFGQKGDWLIKGIKGELYPCKPDIFAATYEPVEKNIPKPTIEELERILEQKGNNVKILLNPDGSLTTTSLDCVAEEGCKVSISEIKP